MAARRVATRTLGEHPHAHGTGGKGIDSIAMPAAASPKGLSIRVRNPALCQQVVTDEHVGEALEITQFQERKARLW